MEFRTAEEQEGTTKGDSPPKQASPLDFGGLGVWVTVPLGGERNLTAHLSSCSWQEVLDNDGFAQGWERGFHDTPHEGLHQGGRDAAAFFHLIQDLEGSEKQLSTLKPGHHGVALLQVEWACQRD